MPVVLVANPKGGVGKSTLATNIAGYFASRGHAVLLGDIDRQQSARLWLGLRTPAAREIRTWDASEDGNVVRPPRGTTHAVIDTQVGVVGMRVDGRTLAAERLREFVAGLGVPVLGELRDTQNYVQLAARGLTLFDIAPGRVQRDLDQWEPIRRWLET
jgi:chromosome partitioning protein